MNPIEEKTPVAGVDEPKRQCPVCNDRLLPQRALATRMKCHNPEERPFKCRVCDDWYFETTGALKTHNCLYFHHIPDVDNPSERRKELNCALTAKRREKKGEEKDDQDSDTSTKAKPKRTKSQEPSAQIGHRQPLAVADRRPVAHR